MDVLKELARKIELQSVLVLTITLVVGCFLLNTDNSLKSPSGILGSVCIGFGILYTLISFFSNQIRESYKDVIAEYRSHISTMKASQAALEKRYGKLSEFYEGKTTSEKIGGEYSSVSPDSSQTKLD